MPELPEVEVVRRGLAAHVVGKRFATAEVLHPRVARRQPGGAAEIEARMAGALVEGIDRRGKYLWLDTSQGALLVHLGMSGQMLIKDSSAEPHKHLRARAVLDDGHEVWFVDQRTFGYWHVGELVDGVPELVSHVASDLLDPALDLGFLGERIRSRRSAIKRVLLDQTVVSGIGNIYADEMLWQARIHGERLASSLSASEVAELLTSGIEVMQRALSQGGTSFDALYVNVNGESGYFSRSLNAYGQLGRPCPRCGTLIVRQQFANRGSHFCPRCQAL
ncbi:Formamidopyrimidine-DNA glycosylase 1 [Corynebacterium kalinowskii]|uniref:Formamidopyrimidine-DNA glycosylase n=1 Tax=Corynebacterium kalinowskii TaxID=2675216 RepID=A0A6B8VRR8_9CORY|nr:bifunctional DNA-formamidopyrimidine glycosylase/DNA-(apurinic or apyrimidinic site) lyase [Corynebacterium kalinowskii]QGU02317.1 Formamidopyrimidine-DNA glycosylase 1 [Corynebacterium kalinowskii]